MNYNTSKEKKIFTGTPMDFNGGQGYFDRESGLICRGLNYIGSESRSVCLGKRRESDHDYLIRASQEELNDPGWWQTLKMDYLVFYTWADPKFQSITRAAQAAGIKVAQFTDAEGVETPITHFKAHLTSEFSHYWYLPKYLQYFKLLRKLPYTLTARIIFRDQKIAKMITSSDLFFAATPQACERYKLLVKRLLGKSAESKVFHVPQPVNFHFKYDASVKKENLIISVGRWNSTQKRTPLLLGTIKETLRQKPDLTFAIYGSHDETMTKWHRSLSKEEQKQVRIMGVVSNADLVAAYQKAKIMLVSSAYEGCHNASAEAVCTGTTIVGCDSPFLEVLKWHASYNSGTITQKASIQSLSEALITELGLWDSGHRDPQKISNNWCDIFHPDKVAKRIVTLFERAEAVTL